MIYNINSKKIEKEIKFNYHFNLSQNSFILMKIKNDFIKEKSNKIIICACKKYIKGQKNGLFLINYIFDDINNNLKIVNTKFYKTENFEPYCFCPLSLYIQKQEVLENTYDIKETNYFLVGGFNNKKGKGIIKLYKSIYNNENKNIEIKYIKDINLENENEIILLKEEKKVKPDFKGPISCISQSKQNGKILIAFLIGNIWLFSSPNIDCISLIEKNEDKNELIKIFV